MVGYRLLRGVKILVMAVAAIGVFGYATMHLWNWLMPSLLGLHTVTFWQALGLVLLSKILFGGFHRHGGGGGRRRFMKEQWSQMSVEEREKFRSGMRGRDWCRKAPQREPVESTSL